MKILAIETSCDDTSISIIEAKGSANPIFKVLAHNISSQTHIHSPYGGVFPALAKREHIKNLPVLLDKTLKGAKLNEKPVRQPVDLIVVTSGPGLEPALWAGIVFAKELGKKWDIPVLPVNHMEGHILSVFGKNKGSFVLPKVATPLLSLLVSGGHTELVLVKKWGDYKIIGETVDDAVGEAFDKVARMLDLPYPGGPEISKLAEKERKSSLDTPFHLPRPMIYAKNYNFSYSGLKTAVLYLIRDLVGKINQKQKQQIALEFENAAIECLTHKTKKAIEEYEVRTLIVGGGVSANKHLKAEMKKITGKKTKLLFPVKELSTDNSIMIGIAGYLKYLKKKGKVGKGQNIKAEGNLKLK